jgi:hypothetical protein
MNKVTSICFLNRYKFLKNKVDLDIFIILVLQKVVSYLRLHQIQGLSSLSVIIADPMMPVYSHVPPAIAAGIGTDSLGPGNSII